MLKEMLLGAVANHRGIQLQWFGFDGLDELCEISSSTVVQDSVFIFI